MNVICPALLLASGAAWGQAPTDGVRDDPVSRELSSIVLLLEQERRPTQRWWWGWLGAYTGLTAGQVLIAGLSRDPDVRGSYLVGATGSLLGALNVLVNPAPGRRGASALEAMSLDTPAERDAALRHAHGMWERAARNEAGQIGFFAHAGGFVVSAATAGVVWLHYDLPRDAVLNLVGGVLITEAQVFTAPRRVHRSWRAHQPHPLGVAEMRLRLSLEPRGILIAGRLQ